MHPTMLLQIAVALVGTAVGVAGLAVARRGGGADPGHRDAWRLGGAAFTLMGVSGIVQNAFGSWALVAGEGTPAWSAYLRAAAGFNYSRNFVELAFLALLLAGVRRRGPGGPWPALILALLAGAAYGAWEGPLVPARHYQSIAVLDAFLFACWSLVMSVAVLRDRVDRWLLLALVIWAVPLPLNALWFFWLARDGTGAWMPRPFDMQVYRLVCHALTLAVVVHRLRLARLGVPVHGLAGGLGG